MPSPSRSLKDKVLMICATKPEWARLKNRGEFTLIRSDPYPTYDGEISTVPVRLIQTGIGMERARNIPIEGAHPLCLHIGISGALTPSLKTGDLLLPGKIKTPGADDLLPDPDYFRKARVSLPAALTDGLFTSPTLLKDRTEKEETARIYGCASVDMESHTIASLMKRHHIPYLSLRAVWDPLHWDLSDLDGIHSLTEKGELSGKGLAAGILKNPKLLLSLSKYRKATNVATLKLADSISALLLSHRSHQLDLRDPLFYGE